MCYYNSVKRIPGKRITLRRNNETTICWQKKRVSFVTGAIR